METLRQYDEAESEARKISGWYTRFDGPGAYMPASVFLQMGRQREAIDLLEKAATASNRSVLQLTYLGHGLGVSGLERFSSDMNFLAKLGLLSDVLGNFGQCATEGAGKSGSSGIGFRRHLSCIPHAKTRQRGPERVLHSGSLPVR